MSLVQITDLYKNYGKRKALDGLSLSIGTGRIVGLLGSNGSGKTTLIKIMTTLITDYQGQVLIDGQQPGIHTNSVISYLPDISFLSPAMRISSAVDLYADLFADFDRTKANEMLHAMRLQTSDAIKSLSKGMQEKLQLSLSLARRAKLYLFDEPIAGVDPAARDFILDTILRNYSENATVLLSTHLIHDIEAVLDDILFLHEGRIVLQGEAETVREEHHQSIDQLFREVFHYAG